MAAVRPSRASECHGGLGEPGPIESRSETRGGAPTSWQRQGLPAIRPGDAPKNLCRSFQLPAQETRDLCIRLDSAGESFDVMIGHELSMFLL